MKQRASMNDYIKRVRSQNEHRRRYEDAMRADRLVPFIMDYANSRAGEWGVWRFVATDFLVEDIRAHLEASNVTTEEEAVNVIEAAASKYGDYTDEYDDE